MSVIQIPAGTDIGKFLETSQHYDVVKLGAGEFQLNSISGKLTKPTKILGSPENYIKAQPTSYCSGISNIIFDGLTFRGRLNVDDTVSVSQDLKFTNCKFLSAQMNGTECVKLARTKNVIIEDCYFERTTEGGANDRLLDIVGGFNIEVKHNNFYKGLTGAIQVKGGADTVHICRNFVNQCGQRAIQIGGSTCWVPEKNTGCWGMNPDGTPVSPKQFGWEATNCSVFDNIVVSNVSAISISTQKNTNVYNNTFYFPPETGGMFLMRLLQEEEAQIQELINASEGLVFHNNVFLYPMRRLDGAAGINANMVNTNNGPLFDTFEFYNNAVYCITPGVSGSWTYQHRHPVLNGPNQWLPVNWKGSGFLDQVYPGVVDWGKPTMRCLGKGYEQIGCKVEAGTKLHPYGDIPEPPLEKGQYPKETEFYGWEGPGTYVEPLDPVKEKIKDAIQKLHNERTLIEDVATHIAELEAKLTELL